MYSIFSTRYFVKGISGHVHTNFDLLLQSTATELNRYLLSNIYATDCIYTINRGTVLPILSVSHTPTQASTGTGKYSFSLFS